MVSEVTRTNNHESLIYYLVDYPANRNRHAE